MLCPKCGTWNPEGTVFCKKCGARFVVPVRARAPKALGMKGFDRFMATMGGMFLAVLITTLLWNGAGFGFWFTDVGMICLIIIGGLFYILAGKVPA